MLDESFMSSTGMIFLGVLIIIIAIAVVFFCFRGFESYKTYHEKICEQMEQINIGMKEDDMLMIMDESFNRSYLKNNRTKYEWRLSDGHSYGIYYKGLSSRSYSGVQKLDIYCRDGLVEEIKPHNL